MKTTITCHDRKNKLYEIPAEKLIFRPSVYSVVIQDEKILLVPQWDGYDFPGGGMDKGESIEETLRRETKEETGLDVDMGEMVWCESDMYYSLEKKQAFHTILMYYIGTDPRGIISKDGFDEDERSYADTAQWVDLKDIRTIKFHNSVDSVAVIQKALDIINK